MTAQRTQRKRHRRSASPPVPAALANDITNTLSDDLGDDLGVDGTQIAATYHWSSDDQTRLAGAIFTAMQIAFEARWVELGLAGVPLPPAAVRHLREIASATAHNATRTHNTAITRFIATWLAAYAAAHSGVTVGARAALIKAVGEWLAARIESHGAGLASFQTLLAHSLADLYAAAPGDLFTVDGPALTATSCPTCIQYYGTVLTAQQAWNYIFPAHPNCEHVLRRLSPDEAARARSRGLIG